MSGTQHTVSGMLLYARTDETILPDNEYRMSGNTISVKTLDLDCGFDSIASQLNAIAVRLKNEHCCYWVG